MINVIQIGSTNYSMSVSITFKPKQITKNLLSVLSPRSREVIERRYGLGKETKKETLESIGKSYGITRERVRQIENHAIAMIHKADVYEKERPVFVELATLLNELGGLIAEVDLLDHVSKSKSIQNHTHFLFVVSDLFYKKKEDKEFKHRWCTDEEFADTIQRLLQKIYESISDDQLISEGELIDSFLAHIKDLNNKYKNEEIIHRWLGVSKSIGKNPLGEWGHADSQNVHAKGMRDYAYLAIKQNGSPMHFREVAKAIQELFQKKAHEATCHNELIKDNRFVLVGRGIYALSEWGYSGGVVKDVINDILTKNGPLTRNEIIERVRKERYVKDNTIIVNLQETTLFHQNDDGTYSIVK